MEERLRERKFQPLDELQQFEQEANEMEYVGRDAEWFTYQDGDLFDVDYFAEPQLAAALCVSRVGTRRSCVSYAFRQQLHQTQLRSTIAVRIAALRVSRSAAT